MKIFTCPLCLRETLVIKTTATARCEKCDITITKSDIEAFLYNHEDVYNLVDRIGGPTIKMRYEIVRYKLDTAPTQITVVRT